jgi:tetratricopeptide (TPR) repeat protein
MNTNRLSKIKTKASLKRMLDRHYDGSLEAFFSELNKESDRLIRTDLKKARLLTVKTAGLEGIIPDNFRAILYRIWARHYHLSSIYPAAHRLYSRALVLFESFGDRNGCARVQKAMLDVMMYLGRYGEGVEIGRRSLQYFRRTGADVDYAQVMTNLGNLYHRLDENRKALNCYNRALKIFSKLDNNYAVALVQFNRGNIFSNLNDLGEAEKLYRQAASIYRSLGMELAACQADYSLAYIAFLKGSYSESLEQFSRVAGEFRRLGDRRCLSLTELDQTEVNLHLNLYSQVIDDALSAADDFQELKMSYERGKAYYLAAAGYYAFGDFAEAGRLTRRSQTLFMKEENRPWQVLCQFLLARIDCREERYSRALKSFREIAAFYKRRGDIRHYHDVRLAWLETLILSQEYSSATKLMGSIQKSTRQLAGYQKFVYHMLAGDMYRERSQKRRAADYYRRAIRQAEKLQAAIFPDEIRRFFWMDKLAAYNRLALIYLDEGRKRQAFEVLERGKSAALLSSPGDLEKLSGYNIPPPLEEERTRLKAYLRKAVLPIGETVRGAGTATRIHSVENRLWKIERAVREQAYPQQWREAGKSGGIEAVRNKLKSGDVLIRFVCRDDVCGAFVMDSNRFEYIPYESSIDDVRGLLARFYFLVNRVGEGVDDQAIIASLIKNISERIWQPLTPGLKAYQRLFIIPDGIFSRLPFYLLSNEDGSSLFEQFDTYLFSCSSAFVDYDFKARAGSMFDKSSIIAVSDTELPGSSLESMAIMRHLPQARSFFGENATSRNFFDSLDVKNGLVHLIAHASQSYENHLFSRILLSDGPLYPFDMLTRQVRSGLVVLSGCQTGDTGLYYYGDNPSLAQTILTAGAREVVASYWPVADKVTCLFMEIFYRQLVAQRNTYRALRNAMIEMRSRSGDIRHWAPFYLGCG